jgi:LPXTG-site transpeptidase (sortase) family protein
MNPDDPQSDHDFGAAFPLPKQDSTPMQSNDNSDAAADFVRQKVEAAYAAEPSAAEEALDVAETTVNTGRTKHQEFIYNLTNSGKSLAEIQTAWHEYYAGLTDVEKHQVWQEFYSMHAQASHYAAAQSSMAPAAELQEPQLQYEEIPLKPPTIGQLQLPKSVTRTLADLRDYAMGTVSSRKKLKPMEHVQSLLFGLGVGSLVVLIVMFSFFNERFIAPFIQPSRNVNNTEIISSNTASGNSAEVIIPKINVEIPVVYDVNTINDNVIETALERGVVHYADTATPGQNGNVVVVGHSSNNIFNPGKYKFAFVLLSRLDNGDTFYLQKDGKRFTYQVYKKEIVKPTDVSVLQPTDKQATATLITCDPPGTSANRLVVIGEQISPEVASNSGQTATGTTAAKTAIIPGNSPSLWSRFTNWFTH